MHTCIQYFEIYIEDKIYQYKYDYFDTREFDNEKIDNSKLTKEEIEKWKTNGKQMVGK
ncbi:hypothetical protein [Flavobacterium sp. GSB-24]|uniref:hypothetical protein n=1 Tax=Flavobacterium sp. GSB-24 TaxID=2994319 RepID=UPI00249107F6|nr:hypothetical protein [Flavobacterium sp. GSB-24]